jgi:hypothetical protein
MLRTMSLGLAISLAVSHGQVVAQTSKNTTQPEGELVVRISDGLRQVPVNQCPFRGPGFHSCDAPFIANEAWERQPTGRCCVNAFLNAPKLKEKYAFRVYTTKDVDDRISALAKTVADIQDNLRRNEKKLDDAERSILLRIDKLPNELPTNAVFYQQIRDRLKSEVAADLQKAKGQVPEPSK